VRTNRSVGSRSPVRGLITNKPSCNRQTVFRRRVRLAHDGVERSTPAPVVVAEPRIGVAVRVTFAVFLPELFERQVQPPVRPQFLMHLGKIRQRFWWRPSRGSEREKPETAGHPGHHPSGRSGNGQANPSA